MASSISVSEPTRNKLLMLKLEEGRPSVEELLKDMIVWYKKRRLIEASAKFRERMDKKKLILKDLVE